MKTIWWWVIGIVVVVGVAFAAYHRQPQANGETVKIGAPLGLTGSCATWGEGEQKAIQLAVDEANDNGGINGKPIELLVEDMQCDPKGVVNATNKLIDVDGVEAIIGPTWGDSYPAGWGIMARHNIVGVSPSTAMEALLFNKIAITDAYSTWFPQKNEIDRLEAYMQTLGKKNIVIMHDEDPFGLMMMDLFKQDASAHDVRVLKEYKFPIGYDDFRTTITELKSLKPDGVYAAFQTPEMRMKFLKQAHELGFNIQLFGTTDMQDESLSNHLVPS